MRKEEAQAEWLGLMLIAGGDEAGRIEFELARAERRTLVRWVKELLDDRRAHSEMLQGQARRLAHCHRG